MFPATVSQAKEVYFWKTMPRSRPRPDDLPAVDQDLARVGKSRPAMMRRMVDLPQPDGPSSTRNSPMSRPSGANSSSTSRLTSRRASIFSPDAPVKMRETLRSVILLF